MIGILTSSIFIQTQPAIQPAPQSSSQLAPPFWEMPNGTLWFYESFSTTELRDDSVTTVDGWGSGILTSPRDFSVEQLGYYNTSPYAIHALSVQGRAVVIAGFQEVYSLKSLQYLNVTVLQQLEVVDTDNASTYLSAVNIDGDTIFVGANQNPSQAWSGWLGIYNASTPHEITSIPGTSQWLDGGVIDLEIQGHFLYAALTNSSSGFGLGIWDIIDPRNPTRIINTYSISEIKGLAIAGEIALLACGGDGLEIVNISTPNNLGGPLGSLSLPGITTEIHVDGAIAYASAGPAGVHIIDISDPTNPQLLSTYNTTGNAQEIALQGKTLFVADGLDGVTVLDVINPANPLIVTQIELPFSWDVKIYGGDLLVATDRGVYTYRIGTGLTRLPVVGNFSSGLEIQSLQVNGEIAYLAAGSSGLVTLNMSDPAYPSIMGQDTQGSMPFYHTIKVQGHLAYVTNYFRDISYRGLLVYDVSDPTNLEFLGKLPFQFATDLWIAGELAYVANGPDGVVICNVSNPQNPVQITSFDHAFNATGVAVQGYHLFVADSNSTGGSFYIYNLLNINTPIQIGVYEGLPEVEHTNLVIDGDVAYSINYNRLLIWNITDPANLIISTEINHTVPMGGIALSGPYLLTVNGTDTNLYNTTRLSRPEHLTSQSFGVPQKTPIIHGDYVFLTSGSYINVLRYFQSAGTTFKTGISLAQSIIAVQACDPITWLTLFFDGWIPNGTDISWEVSSSLNNTWYPIEPEILKTLPNAVDYLYWRAFLHTSRVDRSVHISTLQIEYRRNFPPEPPILYDPGGSDSDGSIVVSWSPGFDREGILFYRLQMSNYPTFASITDEWILKDTSLSVTGLTERTYYFRVLLVDIGNRSTIWSNIESITIDYIHAPTPPVLSALNEVDEDGLFWIYWSPSSDADGLISNYEVQMSYSNEFITITNQWTTKDTTLLVHGLSNGTYYLRVRSMDNDHIFSSWSNVASTQVLIPAPETSMQVPFDTNLIIGFGIVGLIIVGIVAVAWLWQRRRQS